MFDKLLEHQITLALITALLGLITYIYQSRRKRIEEQSEKKRQLYESLIGNVFKLLSASPGRERSETLTEIEKSWLFASDQVLQACYKILDVYYELAPEGDLANKIRNNPEIKEDFKDAVAELFFAMRKEYRRSKTKIDLEWAKHSVNIYDSGAPSVISKN